MVNIQSVGGHLCVSSLNNHNLLVMVSHRMEISMPGANIPHFFNMKRFKYKHAILSSMSIDHEL